MTDAKDKQYQGNEHTFDDLGGNTLTHSYVPPTSRYPQMPTSKPTESQPPADTPKNKKPE